jgi:hypothetical protein
MTTGYQSLVQCQQCHNYGTQDDSKCPHCGALLPKGVAEMRSRSREMPKERAQQMAAHERLKLEATHVPRWMRRVVTTFRYAYEDSLVHKAVQVFGGLIGFSVAFGLAGPLVGLIPMPTKVAKAVAMPLEILVGMLGFYIASHFIFAIFYNVVEAMAQVFGEEQDAMILKGMTRERASRSGSKN